MELDYLGRNKRGQIEWKDSKNDIVMEEWHAVRYRNFVERIEKLIGRDLEKKEARTVSWLSGFEEETVWRIGNLMESCYENGRRK